MRKNIIVCFILFSLTCFSQVTIKGVVKDISGEFLENANIIAQPLDKKGQFKFTTTNNNGEYQLILTKNISYKITISFIGYITLKEKIYLDTVNFNKNFILKEDPNELEEVVINYREPIQIKKDTTTYRVEKFINGKERKLRQVLKKLPGVEVDRKGNVTVKGKKVTTVLVEDKTFFTGDSKLAVNNIPADVIKDIQVIEDYHESNLMKGLENSGEIAMNIKLKEDKKKFVFGDIEVGAGVKDRYLLHPAIFKYSKKVNYNFIGDFNNTVEKSFTLRDYMSFEGAKEVKDFASIFDSPIFSLLNKNDYKENKHLFGAANIQWSPNLKNDWSFFTIVIKDKVKTKNENSRNYFFENILEEQQENGEQEQKIILSKLELKSKPREDVRLKFDIKSEIVSGNTNNINQSNFNASDLRFNTLKNVKHLKLKSNFKLEKKFSVYHTSQFKIALKSEVNKNKTNWISEQNIFSNSLPVVNSVSYDISQKSESLLNSFNSNFTHFWIVNPRNHIYFKVNNKVSFFRDNNYVNQLLPNNSYKEFENFNNNFTNNRIVSFLGFEYKKIIGDAFLTLELLYQNYNRTNKQLAKKYSRTFNAILPSVNLQWDMSLKNKLNFIYKYNNTLPRDNNLALNKKLLNYNTIYTGNVNLRESYYHYFGLYFRKFQTYGWSYYPSISYKIKENTIQNTFLTNTIYNNLSSVNILDPRKELSGKLKIVYNYKYWKAYLENTFRNSRFVSKTNNLKIDRKINTLTSTIGFRSVFINSPNFDISYKETASSNENIGFKNIYNRKKFDFSVEYEKGDWQFFGELLHNFYKNKTTGFKNSFTEINSSIFYNKEDSLWSFEVKANNLLNNKYKLSSNFSDVLQTENKIYVFPRTVMFKVIYKL